MGGGGPRGGMRGSGGKPKNMKKTISRLLGYVGKYKVLLFVVLGSPIWLSLLVAGFAVLLSLFITLWSLILALWAVFVSVIAFRERFDKTRIVGTVLGLLGILLLSIPV